MAISNVRWRRLIWRWTTSDCVSPVNRTTPHGGVTSRTHTRSGETSSSQQGVRARRWRSSTWLSIPPRTSLTTTPTTTPRFRSRQDPFCADNSNGSIVLDFAKCIKCGICVRITAKYQKDLGLTFIGRGFDVVVGVPFNESTAAGLQNAALEVADACPTGAITRKEEALPQKL